MENRILRRTLLVILTVFLAAISMDTVTIHLDGKTSASPTPMIREAINEAEIVRGLSNLRSFQPVPEDGFYKAFQHARKEADRALDLTAADEWQPLGPFNQAGRMLALAVDPVNPNTVWAGAASGGLWKLTITGEGPYDYEWEYIDTGRPVLGVRTIAIHPTNPNILYIGTGEAHFHRDHYIRLLRTMYTYGIGLLKTTDGGQTWTHSLDWSYFQSRGVLSIEINPKDPDTVFAGTTEGTYRSTDAGQTWQLVHPVLMGVDVIINPENPDIVFVSCGNAGSPGTGIYRSLDGGDTWERLSNGLPETWTGKTIMDIYRSQPNVIYADIVNAGPCIGLYKSVDNGDSWTFVTDEGLGNTMGMYAHYIRVNPSDSTELFRTEAHYGYSDDGGSTWVKFNNYTIGEVYAWEVDSTRMHVDHHVFANHPTDPHTFYAGNDGGIYRTRDGGRTFQDLNRGLRTTQFYPYFASSQSDPDFALGGMQDQGTSMFQGIPNWFTYVMGSDGSTAAIDQTNNDIFYISAYKLTICKTENRGQDFQFVGPVNFFGYTYEEARRAKLPAEDELSKMSPYVLLPGNIIYAATNYVYKSTNGGETWKACCDPALTYQPIMAITASEINTDVVYVASRPYFAYAMPPQVFATFNGGDTWTDIKGILPDRDIMVTVSPHDPLVVYAVIGGFGTPHLYRSVNGGMSWQNVGLGLPDVPTNAVAVDPDYSQNIYVGNDLGVWASTDNGGTWSPYQMGMPTASIVIDFNVLYNDRKIRAVTHGNGVFERSLLPPAEDADPLPVDFTLYQNYPNPFNSETTIEFKLSRRCDVSLTIFNTLGQPVKTFDAREYIRGRNPITWNGMDDADRPVPSGIYLLQMKAEEFTMVKRMTLIR